MKANDLNDSHIGQRFRFEGSPVAEGVFDGFAEDETFDHRLRIKIVDCTTQGSNLWSRGYWIMGGATVIPSRELENVDPVRDKLAEYILDEYGSRSTEGVFGFDFKLMAEIFIELMEGGADAS